ncbi:unnamed protein product [Clonostachys chloroleuca]|uniref:Uncharacterized protein n=1 Tax=Clonostachys chloroleuca TaxID=1926264 RepID=A0AA35M8I0_9HYPO|nr:unnamed protein product [Clonostachys chloroleuca]
MLKRPAKVARSNDTSSMWRICFHRRKPTIKMGKPNDQSIILCSGVLSRMATRRLCLGSGWNSHRRAPYLASKEVTTAGNSAET